MLFASRSARRVLALVGAGLVTILIVAGALVLFAPRSAPGDASSTFASWGSWTEGGAQVAFVADTSIRHAGGASLRVTDASPAEDGTYGAISQHVPVTPGTRYEFSVRVRADDARQEAGSVFFGTQPDDRRILPGGSYDWREVRWTHTTGATESVLSIALQVQDLATFWFDEFTVVAHGTDTSILSNGGFEAFENEIGIGVSELIFAPGEARVPISSPTPEVDWEVHDHRGEIVRSGTAELPAGDAILDLRSLEPGYYRLDLSAAGAARSTSFTIVEALDAPREAGGSRFGTTIHPMLQPGLPHAPAASALGLGAARVDLRWEAIELSPGVYSWDSATDEEISRLTAQGVRPILVVAYYGPYDEGRTPSSAEGIAGYANFVRAAAERYGEAVDYEIYNEFNIAYSNGQCGRSPACYLQLLEPAARAVREAAPAARVVGPALAGHTSAWLTTDESYDWLAEFFALGGLDHVDVVSVHNYGGSAPPEGQNDAVIRRIVELMARYPAAAGVPLWLDETGYFTTGEAAGGVDEMQQARYLVRDATLALAEGVDAYMVYDLLDDWNDPGHPEANFGLLRNPASQSGLLAPKPAFTAMAVLTRQLEGRVFAYRDAVPAGVYSLAFESDAGEVLRVMWSLAPTTVVAMTNDPVTVVDRFGRRSALESRGGRVTIELGADPVYVTGNGIDRDGLVVEPVAER